MPSLQRFLLAAFPFRCTRLNSVTPEWLRSTLALASRMASRLTADRVAVTTRFVVRRMVEGDIPQVVVIEHESFPTTWPQTAYRRELSNNIARYLVVIDEAHPAPRRRRKPAPPQSFFDPLPPQPHSRRHHRRSTLSATSASGSWSMRRTSSPSPCARPTAAAALGELLLADAIDLALYEPAWSP